MTSRCVDRRRLNEQTESPVSTPWSQSLYSTRKSGFFVRLAGESKSPIARRTCRRDRRVFNLSTSNGRVELRRSSFFSPPRGWLFRGMARNFRESSAGPREIHSPLECLPANPGHGVSRSMAMEFRRTGTNFLGLLRILYSGNCAPSRKQYFSSTRARIYLCIAVELI